MTLRALILRNILRSPRNFLFSSAGLVLGVTSFILFLAAGAGLQDQVLRRVFVVDQVQVSPARTGLLGRTARIDTEQMEAIAALDGVVNVYPRQQLAFPSYVVGGEALLGTDLWAELIADGVPGELMREDLGQEERDPFAFTDWETISTCAPGLPCAPSHTCQDGACVPIACDPRDEVWALDSRAEADRLLPAARQAAGRRARIEVRDSGERGPPGRYRIAVTGGDPTAVERALRGAATSGVALDPDDLGCPEAPAWCHPGTRQCRMPVPVVASTRILELYNSNVQTVLGGSSGRLRTLPRLSEEGLRGFQFDALLGQSFLGRAQEVEDGGAESERLRMHLVGFSPRAIPLGATLPIGYVSRWNATYRPDRGEDGVDSLLVVVRYSEDLDRVARQIEAEFNLVPDAGFETSRRASLMVTLMMGILVGLSLLIVSLAALNIMNTLLMIIAERRREIGVLRALGATRVHLQILVVGEAVVLAVASTAVSWGLALVIMAGVDAGFASWTPDFPFKPETLFVIRPLLVPGSMALAVAFCILGAWLPARRAGRMDPAVAFRAD